MTAVNNEQVFHCMKDCVTHYKFTKMSKPVTESESVSTFTLKLLLVQQKTSYYIMKL